MTGDTPPASAPIARPRAIRGSRTARERRYDAYIASFNARDLSSVRGHLSDLFTFDRGDWPPLDSPEDFIDFYEEAWAHFDERIRPLATRWTDSWFIVTLEVSLVVTSGWADFPGGPLQRGDAYTVQDMLGYRFDQDDRILCIVALDGDPEPPAHSSHFA